MAIYRGTGGSGDSNQDATLNEVTQQAINAADSATGASTSASNASTSAGQASASATNSANSATAAASSESNAAADAASALASKNIATTKASEAATSATNAANSAAEAANKLPLAGGAMTGAITTNSTFDGRDVATDGTKLDGVADNATNYSHPANHAISVITGLQTALDAKATTVTVNNLSTVYDPIGASVAMAIALGG